VAIQYLLQLKHTNTDHPAWAHLEKPRLGKGTNPTTLQNTFSRESGLPLSMDLKESDQLKREKTWRIAILAVTQNLVSALRQPYSTAQILIFPAHATGAIGPVATGRVPDEYK
jgi:hypothetical protein